MADVNTVVLVGRLTRDLNSSDPREFAYTPNGQARANISVAVSTRRRNGDQWVDESNFFNVTIWGKTAENLKTYLTKGKMVAIEGSLKQDRWQDKETGKTRERVYIVADNIQLLGGGNATRMEGGFQPSVGAAPTYQQQNVQQGMPNGFVQNGQPMQSYQPVQNQPMNDMGYSGDLDSFPDEVPF